MAVASNCGSGGARGVSVGVALLESGLNLDCVGVGTLSDGKLAKAVELEANYGALVQCYAGLHVVKSGIRN